jgi:hypothetical protein
MTEHEWQQTKEPAALLEFMAGKVSRRKLRLAGCACCRRVLHLLANPKVRLQVFLGEEVRDEAGYIRRAQVLATEPEVSADYVGTLAIFLPLWVTSPRNIIAQSGLFELARAEAYYQVPDVFRPAEYWELPNDAGWLKSFHEERARQVALVKEIVGNPFRVHAPIPHVPGLLRQLAEAVHHQDTSAVGPLADALLDAGLTGLAEHFGDPTTWHPKGCWAIDLLTGRE